MQAEAANPGAPLGPGPSGPSGGTQPSTAVAPTDPAAMRVLVVDSRSASRTCLSGLLRECGYQVKAVKTSAEALQHLLAGQLEPGGGQAAHRVDLVIKEHEPPAADAGRLLRKMARSELLRRTPVVVVSSQDEREVVMNCLTLGAIDYLVKPLRHNELRHIWTRVWWWRRSGLGAPIPLEMPGAQVPVTRRTDPFGRSYQSSESKETKCEEEEEPTSKEGSAPDANNGSNGNGHGSNGSKDGNGTSRVEAKAHDKGNGNGNGSSDNKNGHHGSNGNGASTTQAAERNGAHPLAHTAEGRAPQGLLAPLDTQMLPKVATGRSLAFAGDAYNTPPASSSRKRPFVQVAEADETPNGGSLRGEPGGCVHPPDGAAGGGGGGGGGKSKAPPGHRERAAERHERERERAAVVAERAQAAARNAGGSGPMGTRGASGSHPSVPSQDTTGPSQRTQLLHGAGAGGSNGAREGVGSASGGVHGSGSGRTAPGTTGGSGAVPTGTGNAASAAHFVPHHLQASAQGSLTHGATLGSWQSLGQAAGTPGGHMAMPTAAQPAGYPSIFPGPFGLSHMLSQPLAALSMYAAHASPTVSGPNDPIQQAVQAALNPMATSMLAMQLNHQQQAAAQMEGVVAAAAAAAGAAASGGAGLGAGSVEGCSSGGMPLPGSAPARSSGGPGVGGNETSGSITAYSHANHLLLAQYLQAVAQLNPAMAGGRGGAVTAPLGSSAQAAMAAAWAASATGAAHSLLGGLGAGASSGLFPTPGLAHGYHHGLHGGGGAAGHGPPGAGALPATMPALSAGNRPSTQAMQLAMQHSLLTNPALSMAAAAAVAANIPHSPSSVLRSQGMPALSMAANHSQGGGKPAGSFAQPGMGEPSSSTRSLPSVADPHALMMLGNVYLPNAGLGMPPGLGPGPPGLAGLAGPPGPGLPPSLALSTDVCGGPEVGPRKRRAMALDKYRLKRKNLKFSSAIRYETRKVQAQARPRIKGQFAKAAPAGNNPHSSPVCAPGDSSMAGGGGQDTDQQDPTLGPRPMVLGEEEDEEYDHGADEDDVVEEGEEDKSGDDLRGGVGGDTGGRAGLDQDPGLPPAAPRNPLSGGVGSPCVPPGPGDGTGRWGVGRHRVRPQRLGKHRLATAHDDDGTERQSAAALGDPAPCDMGLGPTQAGGGLGGAAGHGAQQGTEELGEDEEDVVDSLRELKEGHRGAVSGLQHSTHPHGHGGVGRSQGDQGAAGALHASKTALPAAGEGGATSAGAFGHLEPSGTGHPVCAPDHVLAGGPQASLSQSGLASKGSLGRTSQHQRGAGPVRTSSGHALGGQQPDGGGLGARDGGVMGPREGRGDNRDPDLTTGAPRAGGHARGEQPAGGKANGSDSGSNSPDENGGNGNGSGHSGHATGHRHEAGGGAR